MTWQPGPVTPCLPCQPAAPRPTPSHLDQVQELLEAERERRAAAKKKKRRLPRGTSEYQAAWIVDDEFSDASDDEDGVSEDGRDEGMDDDGVPEGAPLGAGLEMENSDDDLASMFGGADGTEFGMDVRRAQGRGCLAADRGRECGLRAVRHEHPREPARARVGSSLRLHPPVQYNDEEEEEEDVGERWRRQRDDREFPDEVRSWTGGLRSQQTAILAAGGCRGEG